MDRQFFIENKGQWLQEVLYLARLGGLDAWITRSSVVYNFFQPKPDEKSTDNTIPSPGIKNIRKEMFPFQAMP